MLKSKFTNYFKADLQTAQNRMFQFVKEEIEQLEKQGYPGYLQQNEGIVKDLFFNVQNSLYALLAIPEKNRNDWHMGIADSGKRAIELLVNFFCPAYPGQNVVVNTENYVAFNKFSAAAALKKQKATEFGMPFALKPGQALTVNSEHEFEKAKKLLQSDRLKTLWIAWNSTSTGVQEKVEDLVAFRNNCGSQTLIIADAASLQLFTKKWETIPSENRPDVFFFSLRKQGLPYDGPQDEINQAKNSGAVYVFNEKAIERIKEMDPLPIYDSPNIPEIVKGEITHGLQRSNHIKHLLKLKIVLNHFLQNNPSALVTLDRKRRDTRLRILNAFSEDKTIRKMGFSLLADPDTQSSSVYIVKVPENNTAKEIISRLKDKGVCVSGSMHPNVDHKRFMRFAFYPENSPEEIECLLSEISRHANL